MKRGIKILILWLLAITVIDFFYPVRSVPRNGTEVQTHRLAVIAFPLAAWFYARHSGRLAPVICYGLIAGVYCVFVPLPIFYNARSLPRQELSVTQQVLIFAVPILMASMCAGLCMLRRFLEREDEKHDA